MTRPATMRPKLTIHSIFDPDGTGQDFSYTEGMSACGLPELHLWGRPTHGDDPGDDWMFSASDRRHVLSKFADRLWEGDLPIGEEIVESFDHDLTEVRFRPGAPTDPRELDAFVADEGATVIPLRWSLHRGGQIDPEPLGDDEQQTLVANIGKLAAIPDIPAQWRPNAEPTFETDQVYGPMTQWVLANGAALACVDVKRYDQYCEAVVTVAVGDCDYHSYIAALEAFARAVRRSEVPESLRSPADRIVDEWLGKASSDEAWKAVHTTIGTDLGQTDPTETADMLDHLLRHAVHGHLVACALWDVIPDDLKRMALGPLAFTQAAFRLCSPGPYLGTLWRAPYELRKQLFLLMGDLEFQQLLEVAGSICVALQSTDKLIELRARLLAWTITGTAALDPPRFTIDATGPCDDRSLTEQARELEQNLNNPDIQFLIAGVVEALTTLAAAVAFRERLLRPDIEMLAELYEPLIPGAGELILGGLEQASL